MLNAHSFIDLAIKKENVEFSRDVCDFFAERRAGHMSRWLYSTTQYSGDKACGAEAWQRAIADAKNGSAYYVFQKEREIIRHSIPIVRDIFAQDCRFIDLGPGSTDAVQHKIIPFIESAGDNITEYACVDVCAETLTMAAAEVAGKFPSIQTSLMCKDFIQDAFRYGKPCNQEVAAIFGLTLCNMAIDPRVTKLPEYQLAACLKRLQSHFTAKERYILITQDINQDIVKLREAYLALREHYTSVLYRIGRDLSVSGDYDPENFVMEVDYFPETQACALCFVAKKTMHFSIDDEHFDIRKHDRFYFHNAFKFDIDTFVGSAKRVDLQLVHSEKAENNPCVLHIFKSA